VWRALNSGKVYVVDADLKACFDTIPHDLIMRGLKEKVSDGKILGLVQAYLSQGVMEAGFERTSREGTPQGSVISPLLSNIALHGLDCLAQEEGYELIRYADDFVVLCTSSEEAQAALASVKDWTTRNGLMLHPSKTRLVDYGQGESFDFLGFTFKQGGLGPRKKAIGNLRSKVRDKTPRLSGKSLKAIVSDLNPILRGWWRYFRASPEHVFREGDYFVRKRLRVILDRRSGRKHHHRSGACLRWPNAVFEKAGLISMQALSKAQSSR
jgi:RNA-directed DNA polymerase